MPELSTGAAGAAFGASGALLQPAAKQAQTAPNNSFFIASLPNGGLILQRGYNDLRAPLIIAGRRNLPNFILFGCRGRR
jgi:hypothetical protein